METSGAITPTVVDGVHLFPASEVRAAIRLREGRIAGRAFELFEVGKTPVQVVMELNADPQIIHDLHRGYHELLGNWVVEGPGSLKAWEPVYRLGKLTARKLLRALEIVCANPALRAELRRLDPD
jgi:hypothetical protein